ncbi:hypothetical protein [Cupriavidus sp. YR651]|uniref:hypothetical protein n=1 Tax=Cupriavidus sp. YR651 TaxID=1855315 RepID=UPI00115FFA9E|nr:hypothetical protein [Cupriavidus sp. YR651]
MQHGKQAIVVDIAFAALTLLGQALLSAYGSCLEQRMSKQDGSTWTVQVNGSDVGAISDAEMAAFRRRAVFSVDTYLRQIANIVMGGVRLLYWLARYIPIFIFWCLICGLIVDASGTQALLKDVVVAAMGEPGRVAALTADGLRIAASIALFLLFGFPWAFGIRNEFRAEWERAISERLRLYRSGRVALHRDAEGHTVVFANEGRILHEYLRDRRGVNRSTVGGTR